MKALRPNKKWVLAIIGLLLALLVLKTTLFLTAKPKIAVDYVAEYNRITCPENYDPNDNAAPYYQKAFDAFVEMPEELRKPYINWPEDFNDIEQALLDGWLASNSQVFEYFKIAANKPYYWLERQTNEHKNMFSIMLSELNPLKYLSDALMWNAKLTASKGRLQTAFENIIDCYQAGRQKCQTPSMLTEQLIGMQLKKATIDNAFLILDKTQVDSSSLKSFQDILWEEVHNDSYIPDFTTEKLFLYDAIQITFVDNGRGTGRLAWRAAYGFEVMCCEWTNIKMWLNCFFGPTRNQTIQQIEKVFAISDQIMTKTPWQIKNGGHDYFKEIEKINNNNFLLQILGVNTEGIFNNYHKTRAQTEALITVLAILRFKIDKGQFPASLDELVSSGYLESVPMDPYSNGPLVYKLTEDNFKLYSVGEDFVDDGGSNEPKTDRESILRWKYVVTPDIVYWPFKDLKKLCYDIVREAKAQKEIKEANQPK